jgi:hypothetical protein
MLWLLWLGWWGRAGGVQISDVPYPFPYAQLSNLCLAIFAITLPIGALLNCAHIICVGSMLHPHEAREPNLHHEARRGADGAGALLLSRVRACPCAVVSAAFTRQDDGADDGCGPSPPLPSCALNSHVLSHDLVCWGAALPCHALSRMPCHM